MPAPAAAPDTALPSRKTIRDWLQTERRRSTVLALILIAFDSLLFAAGLAAVVVASWWPLKLLLGFTLGLVIGRLFIIGHDACHQSLTRHRGLNRWLGRFVFLPTLTPYSLWEVGHNVVHHGYTNLKGFDFVWAPLTMAEFRALPAWRQRLERLYRSGWAPGLYYLVEIWGRHMMLAGRDSPGGGRRAFVLDRLLVCGFAALWIITLVVAADRSGQSRLLLLACGLVVPFLTWNMLMGFVIYAHHTHRAIVWHDDKRDWAAAVPFVSTTVHLRFRRGVGGLLHHIMEHTAHHVDMGIPLYRLRRAQARLETALPGRITVQDFSWRWYFATAQHCKLFDFERRCWTGFDGSPAR